MKKTAFVLVMAMVLLVAFTASAMADTASGKIDWSKTAGDNDLTAATPHKGYTLATEKCLVCHAVHKANVAGEVLLDDTVGNACNYCHVSGNTISIKKVYDSDPTLLEDDSEYGHEIAACSSCHSIHGANTVNQAGLSSSILKTGSQTGVPVDWNQTTGSEEGALSAFCSGCHPYFTDDYALSDASGDVLDPFMTAAPGPYNSHIMTGVSATYGNTEANYSGQVAWTASSYCISCHDAGRNAISDPADSFPHRTTGARFMKSAESEGATATAAASPTQDGVCLKCHVSAGGGLGVGVNF